MARNIIRAVPLYFNGKKIAEVSNGGYNIASGDEAHVATEGYFGHSDGATMTKINADCIIPVKGMSTTVEDVLLNKKYCQLGLPVNGKSHQIDMRCITCDYKWDFKTGSFTGTFTFEGGAPETVSI